jgi:hypothetical protein
VALSTSSDQRWLARTSPGGEKGGLHDTFYAFLFALPDPCALQVLDLVPAGGDPELKVPFLAVGDSIGR